MNDADDLSPLPPPPERFNIARYCLAAQAAARPDKTALVGGGQERRWCYGELDRAVRRQAGAFHRLGLAPGARLMIRMDDDLSYILTFFAALAGNWCRCPLLHAGAFNWTYTLGVGLIES